MMGLDTSIAALREHLAAEESQRLAQDAERERQRAEHARRLLADPAYAAAQRAMRRDSLLESGIFEKDLALICGEGLEETDALRAVRAFMRSTDTMLVLAGTKGVGKTTAASLAIADSPYGSRMITAARLSKLDRYVGDAVETLMTCPALALDDLGVEYSDARGFFRSLLDELLNERYGRQLRTIITTNATARRLADAYGERILDRVRECGPYLELTGPSLRARQRASGAERMEG